MTDGEDATSFSDGRCIPGQFVRCADRGTAVFCGAGGFGRETIPCEGSTPTCIEGAQGCSDLLCDPNDLYCDGDELMECAASGRRATRVSRCPLGCSGGVCLDECEAATNKDSYLGCDFVAVWMDQAEQVPTSRKTMAISMANATASDVRATVRSGSGILVSEVTVPANDVVSVLVNVAVDSRTGSRIGRTSWRVRSTGPLTVHQFNPPNNQHQFSNDASLLLPTHTFGTEHMVLTWPTENYRGGPMADPNRSMFAVVAVDPDTTITIVPTTDLASGPEVPAIPAGTEATFVLQAGQVLYLHTPINRTHLDLDPSGTRVVSNRPVGVFAGHQCALIPNHMPWCDHLEQQMIPTHGWRSQHVGAQFAQRGEEETAYRIMALRGGTQLRTEPAVSGVHGQTLAAGEVLTFQTSEDFLVEADAPIAMGQFMVGSDIGCRRGASGELVNCLVPRASHCFDQGGIGDPAFLLSVPIDQYLREYVFLVPIRYSESHISVIHRVDAEITINGRPLLGEPSPIAETGWVVTRQRPRGGVNRIEGSARFGLQVYGYDCAVSYAYPGGMGLE